VQPILSSCAHGRIRRKDMIALIDTERIDRAQILAPGFASHDEGNYPTQQTPSIPGMFGDKARAAHNEFSDRTTTGASLPR
jgi:hypothetical protein